MTARPVPPVVPGASPGRRPGQPSSGRPMSLASPPGRPDVVYGFGRIDASGRVADRVTIAIYFPYLAPVVILGAMWLAWQGLIRKRATRTIEGTLWMVVAATAAIALIGRAADFTGVGTTVSNGVTGVLNTAFARLPAPTNSNCVPIAPGDPQSVAPNYAFTTGNGLVDENANELWSVLVCKPWLYGEFGTTQYNALGNGPQTVVDTYGRQLLWSQAFAANENPTTALVQAKQSTYAGIAASLEQNDPAVYPCSRATSGPAGSRSPSPRCSPRSWPGCSSC